MHGMPSLVYHGGYIIECTRSIHENKRSPCFGQWAIIAAWRFSFAAFKIEVSFFAHDLYAISKEWV
jgi:hypothetical protein